MTQDYEAKDLARLNSKIGLVLTRVHKEEVEFGSSRTPRIKIDIMTTATMAEDMGSYERSLHSVSVKFNSPEEVNAVLKTLSLIQEVNDREADLLLSE